MSDSVSPPPVGNLAIAISDLASRLEVGADDIAVVAVEEVTWPDGSIGCPQPGMRYTMALVNGQRIILEHRGKSYSYHSGGGRPPFLCEDPSRGLTDRRQPGGRPPEGSPPRT